MTREEQYKKKPILFKLIRGTVKIFYRRREFIGLENLPSEPSLIIGNHAQMNGPLSCQIDFPTYKYIWCIGQMMKLKEVPQYAYNDFWSHKPKYIRWFFKLCSYLIAPISAYIFTKGDTIGVYKDQRCIHTFKETVIRLNEGANVIIFPENSNEFNEIVNEFEEHFIDVARLYYKRYKKEVSFVPMYNAAKLKIVVFGKPIKYDSTLDIDEQRKMICEYLKNEITRIAKELSVHTVIPYNNVGKKNYKKSK